MATSAARLQAIYDGGADAVVPQAIIDARVDDAFQLADPIQIAAFFLPVVVLKENLTANQKRLWLIKKISDGIDGIRIQAKRERKAALRAAEDLLDP